MGGFGGHRALSPHPFCHFLDEMGRTSDFLPFALGHVEPGAGERRLDLGAGHALRFHYPRVPNAPATPFWPNSARGGTEYLAADADCAANARV